MPGADLTVDECDVSCLDAVRRYAESFDGPLHVLVHNAGVMPSRRTLSADGHELSLATHVLGPHLLTTLVRPALVEGVPSRVTWVTSGGVYGHKLPNRDLEYEQGTYRPAVAYARTKRMQAVLAQRWAEQLRDGGVVVHAAHPGWANTPGIRRGLPKVPRADPAAAAHPRPGRRHARLGGLSRPTGRAPAGSGTTGRNAPGTTPPAPGSPPPSDRPSGTAASD